MADIDITGLKSLVMKLRYADDELIDPVATEVAKFLELHGTCRDTLTALVERGPLSDGDVPSKMERDVLFEVGLCVKVCCNGEDGYNAASQLAWWVLKAWKSLTDEQKSDPVGDDGVIGDIGSDDSDQDLESNAVVSVESVLSNIMGFIKSSLAEAKPDSELKEINNLTTTLNQYVATLRRTYANNDWVSTRGLTNKAMAIQGGQVLLKGNAFITGSDWRHRISQYERDVAKLVKAIDDMHDNLFANLQSLLAFPAEVVVPTQIAMTVEDEEKVYFSTAIHSTELAPGIVYAKETEGPFRLEVTKSNEAVDLPVVGDVNTVVDLANALIAFCNYASHALSTPNFNFFDEGALDDYGDWSTFKEGLERMSAEKANAFYSRVIHESAIHRYGSHHFYAMNISILRIAKLIERVLDNAVK